MKTILFSSGTGPSWTAVIAPILGAAIDLPGWLPVR